MPELPEVQTIVEDLKSTGIIGATVTGARVFWSPTIAGLTPATFCRRIKQQTLSHIWRRGKYIVFDFQSGDHLLIHLRMTGRLLWAFPEQKRSKHEHVILNFESRRQLRFHDTRKFGRFYLVKDPAIILGRLGPEPLSAEFTRQAFLQHLDGRQRQIKPLLLDQSFIAGIGNIYADEALWSAKIHPSRIADSLSTAERKTLYRSIVSVLQQGLKNLGTTLGTGSANFYSIAQNQGRNRDQLMVFRRTDLPCPRCQTPVERMVIGQRSTHICPQCQRL